MGETGTISATGALLRGILRVIGSASLFAVVFVVAPARLLEAIHANLGMGPLPTEPVVGYLARSTSGLYAILGGVFWVASFDLPRHRRLLVYLGAAIGCFGVALVAIDWAAGLPLVWKLWEGPFVTLLGLSILTLARRLPDG